MKILLNSAIILGSLFAQAAGKKACWTQEKENRWYANQPWLVGCNFNPSTASEAMIPVP